MLTQLTQSQWMPLTHFISSLCLWSASNQSPPRELSNTHRQATEIWRYRRPCCPRCDNAALGSSTTRARDFRDSVHLLAGPKSPMARA